MESHQQPESAQASGTSPADTQDEQRLAGFCIDHRQHLPPLSPRPAYPNLRNFTPEAEGLAAEREALAADRAEQRRKADQRGRLADLLYAAGARYRDCTLDSFRCSQPAQGAVVGAVRDYIDGDGRDGLVLYGPVGTGKDHLAFAVCRAAIEAGKTVRWINGQSWFGIIRDAMDTDRSEASLIASLTSCDVLCLSDPLPPFGVLTQFQATMLYRLVDARYSRQRPTICTVNVSSDSEADERMGAATWDRLCHGAYKLCCDWPSHRKPAREV